MFYAQSTGTVISGRARDREDIKKKLKKTELGARNKRARLYVQKETETRSGVGSDMNNRHYTEEDNNKTTSKSHTVSNETNLHKRVFRGSGLSKNNIRTPHPSPLVWAKTEL